MKIRQLLKYIISIPKTIYFNFRTLPIKYAMKFPIYISYNVKFIRIKKGIINLEKCDKIRPLMIRIGFNGTEEISATRGKINLSRGSLYFYGNCSFAEGCVIGVSNEGVLEIGKNVTANKNFFISCNKNIIIGDNVMFGWNCFLFDATGHVIYKDKIEKSSFASIEIGKHVWVCSETHILKGAKIPDESVVAYRSLVTKKFEDKNLLLGGVPAKRLQEKIEWANFSDNEHIKKNKEII